MWDLPRPELEPVSPALAGRFSTSAPPGKPWTSTTSTSIIPLQGSPQSDHPPFIPGFAFLIHTHPFSHHCVTVTLCEPGCPQAPLAQPVSEPLCPLQPALSSQSAPNISDWAFALGGSQLRAPHRQAGTETSWGLHVPAPLTPPLLPPWSRPVSSHSRGSTASSLPPASSLLQRGQKIILNQTPLIHSHLKSPSSLRIKSASWHTFKAVHSFIQQIFIESVLRLRLHSRCW